jgi:hypothetical protein
MFSDTAIVNPQVPARSLRSRAALPQKGKHCFAGTSIGK